MVSTEAGCENFKEPPDEPVILSVEISASKPGLQLQPDYLLDLETNII
jgi:hypothetical protein